MRWWRTNSDLSVTKEKTWISCRLRRWRSSGWESGWLVWSECAELWSCAGILKQSTCITHTQHLDQILLFIDLRASHQGRFLIFRRREIAERERRERERVRLLREREERENLLRERQRLEMERQKLERERLERERLERERVRIEQVQWTHLRSSGIHLYRDHRQLCPVQNRFCRGVKATHIISLCIMISTLQSVCVNACSFRSGVKRPSGWLVNVRSWGGSRSSSATNRRRETTWREAARWSTGLFSVPQQLIHTETWTAVVH